jgi:hypothetical protein
MEILIHWWHNLPAWSWFPIKVSLTILIVTGILATIASDKASEIGGAIIGALAMLGLIALCSWMVWEGLSFIF